MSKRPKCIRGEPLRGTLGYGTKKATLGRTRKPVLRSAVYTEARASRYAAVRESAPKCLSSLQVAANGRIKGVNRVPLKANTHMYHKHEGHSVKATKERNRARGPSGSGPMDITKTAIRQAFQEMEAV